MVKENKDKYLSDPDNELMKRIGSGEIAAFKPLVEKYQRMVMATIYRYTGSSHDVEDLAQEIFFKVFKAAKRYTPQAKFSTWLYRIVANHCFNYRRSQKRDAIVTSLDHSFPGREDEPSLQLAGPKEKQPENRVQQQELETALRRAISELPDRQRMAIVLYRFEGLSYKEITKVLGCSLSSVESLLFRAMTNLKEKLKKLDFT
ncbi:MAG: RNA polymerase sigma factor [Deltaproteobacteria bacterium]|nr:RNA polymerase sigma factor [Deltaproteobacteria bacterium]